MSAYEILEIPGDQIRVGDQILTMENATGAGWSEVTRITDGAHVHIEVSNAVFNLRDVIVRRPVDNPVGKEAKV